MTVAHPDPLPDYASVAAALQRCGMQQCPAELHGLALGMAVAAVPEPRAIWQQEVYAEFDPADVLAGECRRLLDQVFAAAFTVQPDEPMALSLLLPEDVTVSAAHLLAVRDWCQGFLFGLGLAGEAVDARMSAQTRALLDDFAEISRLDTDDVEDSEENRSALIEIEEYLREGVMVIRDELSAPRAALPKTRSE